MATTAIAVSFKVEQLQAGHCFNGTLTGLAGSGTSAAFTITGLASTANMSVGMGVTGTNVGAGAVIVGFPSATSITVYPANSGTVNGGLTVVGDVFKGLLIKTGPTRTFDGSQTNVGTPGSGAPTATNVGTDETSGTGYTSGGQTLTNVTPSTPGNPTTTATTQFSSPIQWTAATFSATAFIVYNSSTRLGGTAPLNGRVVGVYDLGGTQTVSSGTFSLLMPTNDGSNALIRAA